MTQLPTISETLEAIDEMAERLHIGERFVIQFPEPLPEDERESLVVFLSVAAMAPVDVQPVAPGSATYEAYIDYDRPVI